jgi:hypothetical protein
MSGIGVLPSLFRYKAWANDELFAQVHKLNPNTHAAELQSAIRILNHVFVVDRIFAAHLTGTEHGYAATNTPETPTLNDLQNSVAESDRWYLDYVRFSKGSATSRRPPEDSGPAFGSVLEGQRSVAITGAWSLGCSSRRRPTSIEQAVQRSASSPLSRMWSIRSPCLRRNARLR